MEVGETSGRGVDGMGDCDNLLVAGRTLGELAEWSRRTIETCYVSVLGSNQLSIRNPLKTLSFEGFCVGVPRFVEMRGKTPGSTTRFESMLHERCSFPCIKGLSGQKC